MWADYDSFFMADSMEHVECNEAMDQLEEYHVCNHVMDGFERQREYQSRLIHRSGGAIHGESVGRFEFDLNPYVDHRSDRMGVREHHFTTRVRQTGNFIDRPQLVPALQDGLRRAMNRALDTDMDDQDRLFFTISSDRLTSNFQGWGLRAGEWREGGDQVDALFTRLANALNSNEQFEMNDSFHVSITHVRHAPNGSGHKRKFKPGHRATSVLKVDKKSIIQIKNEDDLCCARAIVTAKARVDQHPKWNSIRLGKKIQQELAVRLHRQANVPQGPCGYDELIKFAKALPEYCLIKHVYQTMIY